MDPKDFRTGLPRGSERQRFILRCSVTHGDSTRLEFLVLAEECPHGHIISGRRCFHGYREGKHVEHGTGGAMAETALEARLQGDISVTGWMLPGIGLRVRIREDPS